MDSLFDVVQSDSHFVVGSHCAGSRRLEARHHQRAVTQSLYSSSYNTLHQPETLVVRRHLHQHARVPRRKVRHVPRTRQRSRCCPISHTRTRKKGGGDVPISLLASIRRNWTNASPARLSAFEMVAAASASPSARMTAAWRSCSACKGRVSVEGGGGGGEVDGDLPFRRQTWLVRRPAARSVFARRRW